MGTISPPPLVLKIWENTVSQKIDIDGNGTITLDELRLALSETVRCTVPDL